MRTFVTSILICFCITSFCQPKENYVLLGNKAFKEGKYEEAIKLFTEGIKKKSFLLETMYYGRAYAYFKLEKYDESELDLYETLKLNNSHANAYWLLGRIFNKTKESKKALKYYSKAVKSDANTYLYSNRGLLKIEMNKLKSALKDFDIAIMLDANNPYAYNNRALAYIKLNNFRLASEDLEKALTLKGNNPFIYKHKALLSIAANDNKNACWALHKAIEMGYRDFDDEVDILIEKYCGNYQE